MDDRNTRYFIGGLNNFRLELKEELEYEKFNEYKEAITKLGKLSIKESIFEIVELNFAELKSNLLSHLKIQTSTDENLSVPDIENFLLDLNRVVLNYLSSERTFIDFWTFQVSKTYKENPSIKELFDYKRTSAYYDNFSYRFLYYLRNYAQHCALPVDSPGIAYNVDIDGKKYHALKLLVERDELLRNYAWKDKIKKEINSLPQYIELFPIIERNVSILRDINNTIAKELYTLYQEPASTLAEVILKEKELTEISCLIEYHSNLKPIWFPHKILSKVTGKSLNVNLKLISQKKNMGLIEINFNNFF